VWNNVQLYFPEHTSLHKAATDMKQLSLKLVSEISGQSASQLQAHAESAVQPACTSTGTMHTSVQDPPSYAHMSAFGGSADLLAQSVFMSLFPANSFNFSNPEASLFSLLMSQPVSCRASDPLSQTAALFLKLPPSFSNCRAVSHACCRT
jgi:hypothetical protein